MMIRSLILPAVCLLVAFVTACGGGDADLPALATAAADATPSASLEISAKGTKFNKDTLVVPANREIVLTFRNQDNALHNVAVYSSKEATDPIFRGDLFEGDDTKEYRFQSPSPAVYYFRCDVHPDMNGAFIVK